MEIHILPCIAICGVYLIRREVGSVAGRAVGGEVVLPILVSRWQHKNPLFTSQVITYRYLLSVLSNVSAYFKIKNTS